MFEIELTDGRVRNWIVPNHYPDGSPLVDNPGVFSSKSVHDTMILRPQSLDTFVQAMFFVDTNPNIKTLVFPHVLGGRQDRQNPTGDCLFTLKSIAKMINDRNFDKVIVLDPHSYVTPALIERCAVWDLDVAMNNYTILQGRLLFTETYDAVISPDAGGVHRAEAVARALRVPVVYATKHRDVATGRLSEFSIPPLKDGGKYLVVDDICDGGGTFMGLAEHIAKVNAIADIETKRDLWVTHGIFSKGVNDLLNHYDEIHTTNSTVSADVFAGRPGIFVHDFMKGLK